MTIIATKERSFEYGGRIRTLYHLSSPLTDRAYPLRRYVLKIVAPWSGAVSWLEAKANGDVLGFTPICEADMKDILASAE